MACSITSGIPIPCKKSIGGIQKIYLTNYDNVSGYTYGNSGTGIDTGDTITSIYNSVSAYTQFYTFDVRRETAQYAEVLTTNVNGTLFYEGTLTMFFEKVQTYIRNRVAIIAQARSIAIILDKNGQYWLIGKEGGLDSVSGGNDFGKAAADPNGSTIALLSQQLDQAIQVSSALIPLITIPN